MTLKDWMDNRGVTQAELASKLPPNPRTGRPLTQGAISQWLRHEVPPAWVPDVHRVTGLPMSELNSRFGARQ